MHFTQVRKGINAIVSKKNHSSLSCCCSFSGIGLGKENAQILAEKVMAIKKKKDNWINTRVLIIDESKFCLHCSNDSI